MDSDARLAFFHEDDYCQIQLLPTTEEQYVAREMERLAAFVAEHRQPDGTFDSIYIRPEPTQNLTRLKISDAVLSLSVYPYLLRFDGVVVVSDGQHQPCPTIRAWGDDSIALFATLNKASLVSEIFLSRTWSAEGARRAAAVLPELPEADRLLLVDWDRLKWFKLSDLHTLDQYLREACRE